jgi:F-type H+-transporting ATPase subunit delta
MISSALFARYARALADVVMEERQEQQVMEDLAVFREVFRSVPDVLDVFDSPAIPREAKERVLKELIARYPVSPTTANFLRALLGHNRIRYFHEIFNYYVRTIDDRKGIVAAQVTAASPLSEPDQASLRASLAGATSRTVVLDVRTDPDLLGGLVVQIGSTVYDGSIRTQLTEMQRRLRES